MDYTTYLTSHPQLKRHPFKVVLRWVKIVIFLFLIVSVAWGCGMVLFKSKYATHRIYDVSGQQSFKPGLFFEILIDSLFGKSHVFHVDGNGNIYEYPFLSISSWGEAFTKTHSPFFGCFVYPIGWFLVKLINGFNGGVNNGAGVLFALFATGLLVRLLTLSFNLKNQLNQEKIQILQTKQSAIQAKYKNNKDPAAKRQAQSDIMNLYRKEGLSPFGWVANSFVSLPFLVAMYTAVRTIQTLKLAKVGQIFLVRGVWHQTINGYPIYITLLFVYFPLQILSQFLPILLIWKQRAHMSHQQKKGQNKQMIIQGVMSIGFLVFAASIAAGVAIYWIFSATIQILQILFFHWLRLRLKKNKQKKRTQLVKSSVVPIIGNPKAKLSRAARKQQKRKLLSAHSNFSKVATMHGKPSKH